MNKCFHVSEKKNEFYVLERNKNASWVINQKFHAFVDNSQNHRSLGAVDDLMHFCPWPNER